MVFRGNRWIVMVSCFLTVLWMASGISLAEKNESLTPDMLAIQGSWVRSDAPYVIKLVPAQGGQLQATYFNPRPIHVQKTEVAKKDGVLYVMVLLQDVNYQGSFYLLSYDRAKDALKGTYVHGASKQHFNVDFVRKAMP